MNTAFPQPKTKAEAELQAKEFSKQLLTLCMERQACTGVALQSLLWVYRSIAAQLPTEAYSGISFVLADQAGMFASAGATGQRLDAPKPPVH